VASNVSMSEGRSVYHEITIETICESIGKAPANC